MHSNWAGLQKDLLGQVLLRLVSSEDYVRFSVVSKSWFCLAKENQRQHISRCSQPPKLLITDEENSWKLYDIMNDKVLNMHLRVPNRRFCGSSKGWLIFMDEMFALNLVNPFSVKLRKNKRADATIIRLPSVTGKKEWITKCDYYVFKASLSADPISDPENSVLTVIYGEYDRLAFIRPSSKDKRWTYVDKRWGTIEEVVYSRGIIYAVDNRSKLFSYNINSFSKLELAPDLPWDGFSKRYLALDSNKKELWMVKRYIKYIKDKPDFKRRETIKFKIFKINLDEHEWTEKETLGDVALFVGDNSSVAVVATDFPGCRSDCIYFTHDYDAIESRLEPYGPNDCGVYDITSRRVLKPYAEDVEKLLKLTSGRPPIWSDRRRCRTLQRRWSFAVAGSVRQERVEEYVEARAYGGTTAARQESFVVAGVWA
ncbi:F-box protein At2g26160-like [Argentina anserina]|uniref:F-box protein At2g26160-like n=1 Tax=Argentina anserina TaxID=57926 RepID=UPI0021768CF3|nr:F-box protein At2g26160-like [Potentilla anserina]